MSIRFIAKDLYRLIGEVADLQHRVDAAPAGEKAALEDVLRRKKAERDRLKKALDGHKDGSP